MDVYWLHKAATTISKSQLPAYFVAKPSHYETKDGESTYYAVVRIGKDFKDQYDSHWLRLVKDGKAFLHVRQSWDEGSGTWPKQGLYGRIIDRPDLIDILEPHTGEAYVHDLLLKVTIPDDHRDALKFFDARDAAELEYKGNKAQ